MEEPSHGACDMELCGHRFRETQSSGHSCKRRIDCPAQTLIIELAIETYLEVPAFLPVSS